ncbi:cytochrome oxidase putative small subunit CydP [Undibacterium sp. TJN19]|uniref:cytochrome oxidase putative small subunit CydP n=1 Tax=Undibacterium sp. TJN19 TaxID=3413055 RepID=UPI003BEF58F9
MSAIYSLGRLKRLPLWLEITLAICIKVLILSLLWNAFFSRPQTRHMRLPAEKMEQHLLSPTQHESTAFYAPDPNARQVQTENKPDQQVELKEKHGTH